MTDYGLWNHIFPENMPKNLGFLPKFDHPNPDWMLKLAAWFRDIPQAEHTVPQALAFSKAETKRLRRYLSRPTLPINPNLWLYRYGRALSIDYFWLYSHQEDALHDLAYAPIPIFPITSADLSALGYRGSRLGTALRNTEALWIDSDMRFSREELIKSVKSIF